MPWPPLRDKYRAVANDFLPRQFIQTNSRFSSIKPSRANVDLRGRCDAPVHSRNAPRPRKNCLTVRSVWGTTDVFVTVGRFDHLSLPPLSVRIGQLRRPIPSCRRSWAELAVAARLPAEIPEWRVAGINPPPTPFFRIVSPPFAAPSPLPSHTNTSPPVAPTPALSPVSSDHAHL